MVEQQKSYEHVLTYLEDALRDGKLTLGQSLPPERELAEQLGISRNSVREAVRLLEHMGFLVSSQGAGNFISCNIQRNLQDSFDMLILLQQIDYHQLAELRSGLELQAALLAVDRITDSQVDRLDSLYSGFRQTARALQASPYVAPALSGGPGRRRTGTEAAA